MTKKKTSNDNNLKDNLNLDDITKLDNDLNIGSSNILLDDEKDEDKLKVNFGDLGKATYESSKSNKTWDGYSKFDNVPINFEKDEDKLSPEEILKQKFKFLQHLIVFTAFQLIVF